MGYLTNFYRDSRQKEIEKCRWKVKSSTSIQSADRLVIELKVACDVIEAMEFGKIYGFYDFTRNLELDLRAIG